MITLLSISITAIVVIIPFAMLQAQVNDLNEKIRRMYKC